MRRARFPNQWYLEYYFINAVLMATIAGPALVIAGLILGEMYTTLLGLIVEIGMVGYVVRTVHLNRRTGR